MSNEDERVFLAHTVEELSQRESVRTPVQVFTISADGAGGALIGGTIAVLSGSRDSALLERARVLAASGDVAGLGALLAEWRHSPSNLRRGGGSVTAITRVSYGERVVVDGLLVHGGMDALVALLPYAGGALNDQLFEARSWGPEGAADPDVQTIVILRPPKLTTLEQRILASLPDDVEAAVIGRPPTLTWPGADAAEQMLLAARIQDIADIDDRLRAMQDDRFQHVDDAVVDDADVRFQEVHNHLDQRAADDIANQADDLRAQIQQLMNERDRAEAQDFVNRQDDVRMLLEQRRAEIVDDLGERLVDRQRMVQNDDEAQRDRQEQERQRQEEQQQRQREEQERQRQRQEQERRNEEWQQRADEAAEADAAGADADDDDGGSLREWLDRLENRGVLEGLDARAAVAVLLEVRAELLRRGAIR